MRVVSLDLDGTLVHPAAFNAAAEPLGFGPELEQTYLDYLSGAATLEEAFWADIAHFDGLSVHAVQDALATSPAWLPGIAAGVARLKEAGLRVILTTDQPAWIADVVAQWGIEPAACSPADTPNGHIDVDHVSARFSKWPNLEAWLHSADVAPEDVVHVGNGKNDIPVFDHVGHAIAVCTDDPEVAEAAQEWIEAPDSFEAIADTILRRFGQ